MEMNCQSNDLEHRNRTMNDILKAEYNFNKQLSTIGYVSINNFLDEAEVIVSIASGLLSDRQLIKK